MNFTVYRSSAGSGKTFTLVKEYLKIALMDESDPPQKFRKILAITFTNKAAQEMKDRVIKALKELAAPKNNEPSELAKILIAELGLDSATLVIRSENLLRAILHQYGDFAIGTIDAFTHRIVRNFAYDLGLPVNFEIETESENLLQQAVDKLLSRIGQDKDLTDTLIRFAEEKADDEKSWLIESELKTTAAFLLQENGTINAEKLGELSIDDFKNIREKLFLLEKTFSAFVEERAAKALLAIKNAGLTELDFYQGNKGIASWFRKVQEGNFELIAEPNSYVVDTVENDKWLSGANKKGNNHDAVMQVAPALKNFYEEIKAYGETHYARYITRSSIRRHLFSLAVLNELQKIMREFRDEDNVVHISEFNHIISKVVVDQPVPFIFEKLGARYSHFLIDEFQDTSVLQWQNLLPLIENGLAENSFSMVVGDAKQAIYRWRSGDVEQFIRLPEILRKDDNPLMIDRELSLRRHYREQQLDRNFRSRKQVIEFNNALFLSLTELLIPEYAAVYKLVAQQSKEGNEGGYVELRFPERGKLKADLNEEYTNESISLVKQLLDEGWLKNEIALLTRTNNEGSLLADALIREGIPVLSTDSLLIKNSPLIGCLVSLLRVLEHPEDRISLADATTYLNKTGRGNFPVHAIKQNDAKLADILAHFGITEDLTLLAVLPLYQQCESLVRIVFPTEQKNAWIIFFLDELLRFGGTRNPDRQSFFQWWEDRSKNASVVIPEGTDAVRVTTIHKSKGLEFPVVILPYMNWESPKKQKDIWIEPGDVEIPELPVAIVSQHKTLEHSTIAEQYIQEKNKQVLDQMNVLYVGCTRAVHALYVLSESVKKASEKDHVRVADWLNRIYSSQLDGENTVRFGSKEIPQRKAQNDVTEFIKLSGGEGQWTGKIRIRKYSEEGWDSSSAATPREKGIVIHSLLRRVSTASDIDEVIKDALNSGLIPSEAERETRDMLFGVVDHSELASCFSGQTELRSESEILIPGERSSRPDRVIIRGKEAIILDYKTGVASEEHIDQVKHYRSLLQRMGYSPVSAKLVYLSPLEVVTI